MRGAVERDAGLALAIERAGGVCALARKVGVSHQRLSKLRRVPRARVFEVARAAGVEPEAVRPDLAEWIQAERERQWMERAKARFAIAADPKARAVEVWPRSDGRPGVMTMDVLDLGLIVAAARFAAHERGLTVDQVLRAPVGGGGSPTPEQAARSYAASLAVVVGQVGARVVAGVLGLTRQAVEKAAERYLRARDGDEADELDDEGRVIERGRLRRAKAADESLWAAERRFLAQLAGGEA